MRWPGKHARRKAGGADRTLHLEHVSVRLGSAAETVPAHHAGKAPALGGADHVHKLALRRRCPPARDRRPWSATAPSASSLKVNFLDHLHRRRFGLGKVAGLRLGHVLVLDELHQADLRGLVAVPGQRLQLRNHAGAGLQHRNRVHIALFVEDLRHADLFTQNSCNCHVFLTSSCDVEFIALPESVDQLSVSVFSLQLCRQLISSC